MLLRLSLRENGNRRSWPESGGGTWIALLHRLHIKSLFAVESFIRDTTVRQIRWHFSNSGGLLVAKPYVCVSSHVTSSVFSPFFDDSISPWQMKSPDEPPQELALRPSPE